MKKLAEGSKEFWLPENIKSNLTECFTYLDGLRDSGKTNMFGASSYLASEYFLSNEDAKAALILWMKTFSETTIEERVEKAINFHKEKSPKTAGAMKDVFNFISDEKEAGTKIEDIYDKVAEKYHIVPAMAQILVGDAIELIESNAVVDAKKDMKKEARKKPYLKPPKWVPEENYEIWMAAEDTLIEGGEFKEDLKYPAVIAVYKNLIKSSEEVPEHEEIEQDSPLSFYEGGPGTNKENVEVMLQPDQITHRRGFLLMSGFVNSIFEASLMKLGEALRRQAVSLSAAKDIGKLVVGRIYTPEEILLCGFNLVDASSSILVMQEKEEGLSSYAAMSRLGGYLLNDIGEDKFEVIRPVFIRSLKNEDVDKEIKRIIDEAINNVSSGDEVSAVLLTVASYLNKHVPEKEVKSLLKFLAKMEIPALIRVNTDKGSVLVSKKFYDTVLNVKIAGEEPTISKVEESINSLDELFQKIGEIVTFSALDYTISLSEQKPNLESDKLLTLTKENVLTAELFLSKKADSTDYILKWVFPAKGEVPERVAEFPFILPVKLTELKTFVEGFK